MLRIHGTTHVNWVRFWKCVRLNSGGGDSYVGSTTTTGQTSVGSSITLSVSLCEADMAGFDLP
eukprot:scaffold22418_cov17-Tisochrysis_lutea.AAC.1